jgi:hypothetical protein
VVAQRKTSLSKDICREFEGSSDELGKESSRCAIMSFQTSEYYAQNFEITRCARCMKFERSLVNNYIFEVLPRF